MFGNYEDYLEKMKIYKKLRLAQVEAWSVEILSFDCYKKVDHMLLMIDIFKGGVVDVNKTIKFLKDEGKGRLFTSDNPVIMSAYISLFLKANNCLTSSIKSWVGENDDEVEIFNHGDSDSDHTDIDTDDDFFDF
eukprot:GFUD01054913.1.p1 GENE.GFUD01054913.1~~GFUD01054913.1.p1  ORF type:complete len:134 (+),score=46.37 GFUD01054913.1:1-402(+)